MKKIGAFLILIAVILFLFKVNWFGSDESDNLIPLQDSNRDIFADPIDGIVVLVDNPFAREFGKSEIDEKAELVLVQQAYRDYLDFVKIDYRRPIGDNKDFVTELTGGNLYKIAPIPPSHPRINSQGELVDAQGVPFAIHPIAEDIIEVRSSGLDMQLWTDDDLVLLTERGNMIKNNVLKDEAIKLSR